MALHALIQIVRVALVAASVAGCTDGSEGTEGKGAGGSGGSLPSVILDGGGDAAVAPDGAAACPSPICNYQTGEPCPAGTTCRPSVTAAGDVAPSCQASGSVPLGGECDAWDDCGDSAICADGACRRLCCGGDWSACPEDEGCFRNHSFALDAGNVPTGAAVCFPVGECNALDLQSCDGGKSCQIVDGRGSTACISGGRGVRGDPCPCASGFLCVGKTEGEPGTCRRLCKAVLGGGEPSCPPAEGVCVHYVRHPMGVGECAATN